MEQKSSPIALGTEDIGLLLQYAIPAIIAMTASSIYHITDSILLVMGLGMHHFGFGAYFSTMNLAAAFGSLVEQEVRRLCQCGLVRKTTCRRTKFLEMFFSSILLSGFRSHCCACISRSDSLFLWCQRSHSTLCSWIYGGYSAWECNYTFIHGAKCLYCDLPEILKNQCMPLCTRCLLISYWTLYLYLYLNGEFKVHLLQSLLKR